MIPRKKFQKTLLAWYHRHKRDLPFRHTRDPYKIWISEVIFQQTRISQGMEYYLRFIKRFPDVRSLARASEQEVLSLWQGLGYYARARNLLQAARQIVGQHKGKFPKTFEDIRKLKGIGDYSAAAIASVAFSLPYPAVDANVYRFLARYGGIRMPILSSRGRKEIMQIASDLMDPDKPGDINQAMIEMGALQCIPINPDCGKCPFRNRCYAYQAGIVPDIPIREKKSKIRSRYFNYLVISSLGKRDGVYIRRREKDDIWKNMYEFPLIETDRQVSIKKLAGSAEWKEIFRKFKTEITGVSRLYRHVLSHRIILARFIEVRIGAKARLPFLLCNSAQRRLYPFPRLIEKYIAGED